MEEKKVLTADFADTTDKRKQYPCNPGYPWSRMTFPAVQEFRT
jgi:hypothetical protein